MTKKEKKRMIARWVKAEAAEAIRLSDDIAALAEPGFAEMRSAQALSDYLAARGFRVKRPWRHMPSAFVAEAGRGRPAVGVLAEYDALPDCGAKPGSWGHGCGHNLLGVGSAVAAVAAARRLKTTGRPGRVAVWGCPAEELLAGKVYMARDGAFRGQDAVFGWHPSSGNGVHRMGGSALDSILFEFFGKTAHATGAHAGRSALDGVMLLDVAANYLREHVPENVRIHMCIREGGGAPNVVPAYAKSWYFVRGKDRRQVDEVRERLIACARGAALATGTRMVWRRLTAVYPRLRNDVLADLLIENFKLFGAPKAGRADALRARRLGLKGEFARTISEKTGEQSRATSDQDNVSWLAPFGGELAVACVAKGTTGHHRDYAAQVVDPFAHAGMLRAAETMAGAMLDFFANPRLRRRAQAEFRRRRGRAAYDPLIPARQKPPSANP